MKVLFVSNDAEINGGTSRSIVDLATSLSALYKINITVLLPENGPLADRLKERGIKYKITRYYPWVYNTAEGYSRIRIFIKKILTHASVIKLSRWTKKENIDIIHSANSAVYIGALIAQKTKTKHVWHIREFLKEDHGLEFINKKYSYTMLNSADTIICVSKAVYDKYKTILDPQKMKVVYNGVPAPDKNTIKQINPQSHRAYNLLITGNINRSKGQFEAIRALQTLQNKELHLSIAGTGPDKEEFQKYVQEHHLEKQVTFLGFVKDMEALRSKTDISLVCSANEAFGRVTVESMLHNNLVIGADTGGTLELIQNGTTGILYKQGNYEDLAKKILWCLNNWNKCIKIISSAQSYARNNFTIENCAKKVAEIYQSLSQS